MKTVFRRERAGYFMGKMRIWVFLLALIFAFVGAACCKRPPVCADGDGDPEGPPCELPKQCFYWGSEDVYLCVKPCSTDADCPRRYSCSEFVSACKGCDLVVRVCFHEDWCRD